MVSFHSAHAHHSDAVYDRDAVVAFEATVLSYRFSNPHVMIYVETEDDRGEPMQWAIETGSTPIMIRSGWSADLIAPGDSVSIRAHPIRSGKPEAILNTMRTADGLVWTQIEEEPDVTVQASGLAGVWQGEAQTSLWSQTNSLALTPAGESAMRSYDQVEDAPTARCVAWPPPFLNASTNYLTGIEILDDRVILRNEFFDMERIVYMDGRAHPTNGVRTIVGHSIGWWEDDVLVVDTRLLADHRAGNSRAGVPSGAQKHVIERFSLSDDGARAVVDVFIEDPQFLAEPFIGRTTMVYSPHLQLYSYDCNLQKARTR
jgi:hypothetical protein